MSVTLHEGAVQLIAPSRVEDAEALVSLLLEDRGRAVDLSAAGFLHSSVLQALLVFRPTIAGPSTDPFVGTWLMSLLAERPNAQID